MPEGPIKLRLGMLRDHLQDIDAAGLEVKFWKVAPEFIRAATFQAQCSLLDHFEVPPTGDADTCQCGNCMDSKQLVELNFAKYGNPCHKNTHGLQLVAKYGKLKKGDKFVITNNAGVTTPSVIMRVDANGAVFCSDGLAKHVA